MKIIHDFELMPNKYKSIYYAVRFETGKEMQRIITKLIAGLRDNPQKTPSQIEQLRYYEAFLPFSYNDEDIHPKLKTLRKFISKTKTSTNVEIRKKFNKALMTEFIHAYNESEVIKIKDLISNINIDQVIDECLLIEQAEIRRIKEYQQKSSRRSKVGSMINQKLKE
ncbi:hypothetical protein P9F13_17710, partial [Alkalihalophilus marmarensis]|nr:hypothetical protein [Alkalihalophilus marmarensis]